MSSSDYRSRLGLKTEWTTGTNFSHSENHNQIQFLPFRLLFASFYKDYNVATAVAFLVKHLYTARTTLSVNIKDGIRFDIVNQCSLHLRTDSQQQVLVTEYERL